MVYARCLAILVLLGACPAGVAQPPPIKAEAITGNVWYVQGSPGQASSANAGFTSNAGFVVTDDGVVVFDALGTPALAYSMQAAIWEVTDQFVRRVIVSHYHADHVYGLQIFRAGGSRIWARSEGRIYLDSDFAQQRLAERRRTLAPWVDEKTKLTPADRWLDLEAGQSEQFELGGTRFRVISAGHAHAPDDLMLLVDTKEKSILFAGDLFFNGRLPFVVDANTRGWLVAIEAIRALDPDCIVPGHGSVSCSPAADLTLTAEYLKFLRTQMGAAVEQLTEFDAAYAATDWSRFASLPTFKEANRRNAYSVYLEMQSESLGGTDEDRVAPANR